MSSYCNLAGVRAQLISKDSVTAEDQILADYIETAARAIDLYTGRVFGEIVATYGFTVELGRRELWLYEKDLLAITTLTNADGTVIGSSGYSLYPYGQYPKKRLTLTQDYRWIPSTGMQCYEDPDGIHPLTYGFAYLQTGYDWVQTGYGKSAYALNAVQIAGKWGYHNDYANAWEDTTLTVSGSVTTTQKTLTLSAQKANLLDVGDVLKIDNEYFYVKAPVSADTATTITVKRAYNGSTAATHSNGATIYRWLPEPTITEAAERLVCGMYVSRNNPTGDRQVVAELGAISIPSDVFVKVVTLLEPFYSLWNGVKARKP